MYVHCVLCLMDELIDGIMLLGRATYFQVLGDEAKALTEVRDAVKLVQNGCRKFHPAKEKELLEWTLKTWDRIKCKTPLPRSEQIDFLTSKFAHYLLLPWPPVELPTFQGWSSEPWVDSEFIPGEGWQRMSEITEMVQLNPSFEMFLPNEHLRQVKQPDCSVVCSIVSILNRSYRIGDNLLDRILYPKDNAGKSVYSPSGRYLIQLDFGGTKRVVQVDGFIPYSAGGLLRTSLGSFGPVLIEKAYIKSVVRQGDKFKGSNAALDTYRMTGWFPFYIDLTKLHLQQHKYMSGDSNPFKKLHDAFHAGNALVCLGTGENVRSDMERNHDYSVLDIFDDPPRLKVLNPWGTDPVIYSHKEAKKLFKLMYININPELFNHVHRFNEIMPFEHTTYSHSYHYEAPQYLLLNRGTESTKVTVVASTKQDISGSLDISAYDTAQRMFMHSETHLIDQTPITTTSCLSLELRLPPNSSQLVVISLRNVNSTLSTIALNTQVWSQQPITVRKPESTGFNVRLKDKFGHGELGGKLGSNRYFFNPQFTLRIKEAAQIELYLLVGDKECNLAIFYKNPRLKTRQRPAMRDMIGHSGQYRCGILSVQLHLVQPGEYLIVPSLFKPSSESLILGIHCSSDQCTISREASAVSGLFERKVEHEWNRETSIRLVIIAKHPTSVLLDISDNAVLEGQYALLIEGSKQVTISRKFGESFQLCVYSDRAVTLNIY